MLGEAQQNDEREKQIKKNQELLAEKKRLEALEKKRIGIL